MHSTKHQKVIPVSNGQGHVLTPLGVDGIFHTASPIDFKLDTYEKTVTPAVKGSETILESALKAGPQLQSVVITSSVAAVTNPKDDPEYTFTEKDFASALLERATKDWKDGAQTPPGVLYTASKTAADRAVWRWREEHKVRKSRDSVTHTHANGILSLCFQSQQ